MARRRHHRALPHAEVAASLATVRASAAYPTTTLVFEFLVLTACHSGEVRGVRWDEINLDEATWTIPACRMKPHANTAYPSPPALSRCWQRRSASGTAAGWCSRRLPGGNYPTRPFPNCCGNTTSPQCPTATGSVPRLGSRTNRHTSPGLRTRPRPCQQRPGRSRLPAKRPLRPAPPTHATLGRLPTPPNPCSAESGLARTEGSPVPAPVRHSTQRAGC